MKALFEIIYIQTVLTTWEIKTCDTSIITTTLIGKEELFNDYSHSVAHQLLQVLIHTAITQHGTRIKTYIKLSERDKLSSQSAAFCECDITFK